MPGMGKLAGEFFSDKPTVGFREQKNFRHLKSKYVLIKRRMNMSNSLKSIGSIKFIEFLRGKID